MNNIDVIAQDVTGKVKWFDNSKAFGFIIVDHDGATIDVFVHQTKIKAEVAYRTLATDEMVRLDLMQDHKGFKADNVRRNQVPAASVHSLAVH